MQCTSDPNRLWRDLWCVVVDNYYAAFRNLEENGMLDPDEDLNVICLHYVMLPRINWHLQLLIQTWDHHPLSSEGNRSPQQLWVAGQLLDELQTPEQVCNSKDIRKYNRQIKGLQLQWILLPDTLLTFP